MIVAMLATVASLATGQTCAAIDNGPNAAAWATKGRVTVSTYKDRDRLIYSPAPGRKDNASWQALHAAEASLVVGKRGRKLTLACVGALA